MDIQELQNVVDVLREQFTIDSPATIEHLAAICGIDVNAPGSYRAVLDMSETIPFVPDIVRIRVNGERRYYALRSPTAD
jgi:hypothetical protein